MSVALARPNESNPKSQPGEKTADHRLTEKPRDLNQYCPFQPPSDLKTWNKRREELKVQLQVALGLWPMPPKDHLKPVIHGAIDREEYTVEKVYFASLPGHYVTGNLYRPKLGGKHPAVLCPHGHWANGRMHDAGAKSAKEQIENGAETWPDSARYLLQAKCAQLARMGCVVFHYDMLGYADSRAIPHEQGFSDSDALLWLHSQMGLQTWNSIRALDFVCGLPGVDASRIGCTGGSGGGTQTFILAALDDRLSAIFPAVMVSTGMQGGCVCENAPYLRQGTGNVEIAALFAPKPLGMSGANDWTIEIERKGLPELKALYGLYGASDKVMAKCFPKYGHNYNQLARELMYNWFNSHLKLGLQSPVEEREFTPIPPKDLTVFNAEHPRPRDEVSADGVHKYLTERDRIEFGRIIPKTQEQWRDPNHALRRAVEVMIHDKLPMASEVESSEVGTTEIHNGFKIRSLWLSRRGQREAITASFVEGDKHDGTLVVWIHAAGNRSVFDNGKPSPALHSLLDRNAAVLAVDVFGTGALAIEKPSINSKYAGYTFGYNRPILAERVHDILTAVAFAKSQPNIKRVHLVGWENAGPWVVIARALCGDAIERTAADLNGFRFENVRTNEDPVMLPGAMKYGGMATFAALCAPHNLLLHNHRGTGIGRLVSEAYQSQTAESNLKREAERLSPEKVAEWLCPR
jgi:dienelactone hydrolase